MKYSERTRIIIKCICAFAFPFVLCSVFCIVKGVAFYHLYIPSSEKNDCLFYYKIVEGLVAYGMPRGFFGYNESHSLFGSLAAWSPVLYLPWTLWGRIFGWNSISAILSNIFFLAISLSVFVFLVRPSWKSIVSFFSLCTLYTYLSFYLMNIQPEIMIGSVLLLFFAFILRYAKDESKTSILIAMLMVVFLLILARPYMALLVVFPILFLIKDKNKVTIVVLIGIAFAGLVVYTIIMHYFSSAYFKPLVDTELIDTIRSFHIEDAFKLIIGYVKQFFQELEAMMQIMGEYGVASGTVYIVWVATMISSFLHCFDKENEERLINIGYIIVNVFLLVAIVLFYHSAYEGGRHLFVFSFVGIVLCCFGSWKWQTVLSNMVLGIVLVVMLTRGSLSPIDISIPEYDRKLDISIHYWEQVFEEKQIGVTGSIGYENTVDWIYLDLVQNEIVETRFEELFALPKGMGISCCGKNYILENYDELKSKYIAAPCGGEIDALCASNDCVEIGRSEDVVIYARY